MNGAFDVDRAEEIKWWDVIDYFRRSGAVGKFLRMARDSPHPDALWLSSLFPVIANVTTERMREVMLQQAEDPRAMHFAWLLGSVGPELLERSAQAGYAPAQEDLSSYLSVAHHDQYDQSFEWAQQSASQRFRGGLSELACCYEQARGCERDDKRAIELYKEAARLGDVRAFGRYGAKAFNELDWERYMWLGRAVAQGTGIGQLCVEVNRLWPRFEKGELGRILHTVAPVVRSICVGDLNVNVVSPSVRRSGMLERVLELHEAMLRRARRAIACWSMAGRRRGIMKDMRVMIAKMAWEEPWRWGEKMEEDEYAPKRANVG
jgi:hypothetical protein